MLETVTTGSTNPSACVIWLHGLGADGNDFLPIVPQLGVGPLAVKFIFPHAPVRPVTINGGMEMRAWYDIKGASIADKQDREGIEQSAGEVEKLLRHSMQDGVPARRLFLAGFSQGGAMALHTGLRFDHELAGIICLSGYLPLAESLPDEAHACNADTAIFMAHGRQDPVVPIDLGQRSRDFLQQHQHPVQWQDYSMAHAVCMDEIKAIGRFIELQLPSDE